MIILGLGSNVGDRLNYIQQAIKLLSKNIKNIEISPIYESEAVLMPNSPEEWNQPFLNLAIKGECSLEPVELLIFIKFCEKKIGRINRGEWSPREIDIDILAYDDIVIEDVVLSIPHKLLLVRDFALQPLADLCPDWQYPIEGSKYQKTALELLKILPNNNLKKTELCLNLLQ